MRRSELLIARTFSFGILVWIVLLIPHSESLRGSAVVLQAKTKLHEQKAEQTDDETSNGTATATNSTKPQLTGIPQIDYVLDPNLPRELNGQNLTDYPFYNAVPDEIDFKCDGLHDGFYASVPHKCQVYHHCLFGTRYDFLCANYTAFDQKTFICHFVSEVDCDNSPKYYKRNEALYKEATTTTTTTTTTPAPSTTTAVPQPPANGGMRHGSAGRRRRPYRRRRPVYEYYYDDEEYPDSEYYDEDAAAQSHRRAPNRKQNKETYNENQDSEQADYDAHPEQIKPSVRTSSGMALSVYDRPRVPPKIRRPVPKNERDKYDYVPKASTSSSTIAPTEKTSTTQASKTKTTPVPQAPSDDEYYDEEEEYDYEEPRAVKSKHHMDYDSPSSYEDTRRHVSRHRSRQPVRKRTDMYDDYDVKERPRMNRRKEYTRYDERPRGRPMSRSKGRGQGYEYRRRPEKRPVMEDDYYYDEEEAEEEEVPPKRGNNRRPMKPTAKPKATTKPTPSKGERGESRLADTTTKYPKPNHLRNSKANHLESETPKDNEIPTTENTSARSTNKYKTIKIVNNSLKEDTDDSVDFASTEETRPLPMHTRPANTVIRPLPKTELKKPSDDVHNKTVTTVRHFVVTAPIRKPSHYAILSTPVNTSFREEPPKLPEPQKAQEYYKPAQYVKVPVLPSNQTYQAVNFGSYYVPMEQNRRLKPVEDHSRLKPVEEHISENLNVISNGLTYTNGFITEHKPYDTTKPQLYRQDHRLYTSGERLYTNSISFPQQPPANYDITAPGPSAPAEEPSAPGKKYVDMPAYTANADYDVTYNDALQPSTLHPVRRFPSTSFYVQSHPRRLSSEYAFNDSAFPSPNRSHNRSK